MPTTPERPPGTPPWRTMAILAASGCALIGLALVCVAADLRFGGLLAVPGAVLLASAPLGFLVPDSRRPPTEEPVTAHYFEWYARLIERGPSGTPRRKR